MKEAEPFLTRHLSSNIIYIDQIDKAYYKGVMGRIMRLVSVSIVTWVLNSSFEPGVLPIIFLPNFFIDPLVILLGSFRLSGNIPKN